MGILKDIGDRFSPREKSSVRDVANWVRECRDAFSNRGQIDEFGSPSGRDVFWVFCGNWGNHSLKSHERPPDREMGLFRNRRGHHKWNMNGMDLSDQDLRFMRFEKVDFRKANLYRAHLRGAIFIDCDFRGANFLEANLTETKFIYCDLRRAKSIHLTYKQLVLGIVYDENGSEFLPDDDDPIHYDFGFIRRAYLTRPHGYGNNVTKKSLRTEEDWDHEYHPWGLRVYDEKNDKFLYTPPPYLPPAVADGQSWDEFENMLRGRPLTKEERKRRAARSSEARLLAMEQEKTARYYKRLSDTAPRTGSLNDTGWE